MCARSNDTGVVSLEGIQVLPSRQQAMELVIAARPCEYALRIAWVK